MVTRLSSALDSCGGASRMRADVTAVTVECFSTVLASGDLVLTEVMVNPEAALDTDGEYIEIYNARGREINFQFASVDFDAGGTPVTVDAGTLPAGGY